VECLWAWKNKKAKTKFRENMIKGKLTCKIRTNATTSPRNSEIIPGLKQCVECLFQLPGTDYKCK